MIPNVASRFKYNLITNSSQDDDKKRRYKYIRCNTYLCSPYLRTPDERIIGNKTTHQALRFGGLWELEAATGFEPVDGDFADLCLTTWLRRLIAGS
jgi:hypothetical protein